MKAKLIFVFIGLIIGNFLSVLMFDKFMLSDAIERTFFYFVALFCVYLSLLYEEFNLNKELRK